MMLRHMGPPMLPTPMNPTFMISSNYRHPERSRPKGGAVEGPDLVDATTEQVPPLRLATLGFGRDDGGLLLYLQYQLTLEVTLRADAQRLLRLGQREQRHMLRSHRAFAVKFDDPLHVLALARHGRTQRGHVAAIGLRRRRSGGDEGGATARLENGEGALGDIIAPR